MNRNTKHIYDLILSKTYKELYDNADTYCFDYQYGIFTKKDLIDYIEQLVVDWHVSILPEPRKGNKEAMMKLNEWIAKNEDSKGRLPELSQKEIDEEITDCYMKFYKYLCIILYANFEDLSDNLYEYFKNERNKPLC